MYRDLSAQIQAEAEALVRNEVRTKERVPVSVVVDATAGLTKLSSVRDSLLPEPEGVATPDLKTAAPPSGLS